MHYSERDQYDVGVIVGRFQIHDLHDGHQELLDFVTSRHSKVVVILGCSPVANTKANPLDFETRCQMIQTAYPKAVVLPLYDRGSDIVWSQKLDALVNDVLTPSQNALLYGGRDSFIKAYHGRFPSYEIDGKALTSSTKVRNELRVEAVNSPDFRRGIIWASQNRFSSNFPTVDVAIFSPDYEKILLGKKLGEDRWRLIGGFADPECKTYEEDAIREAWEEARVHVDYIQYLMSDTIDDWRYRSEDDKIKSLLFIGSTKDSGAAGDDIDQVKWFWPHELVPMEDWVMPNHLKFVRVALDYAMAKNLQGVQ